MPNWCGNLLVIRLPGGDDLEYPQFDKLREFLAGTLRGSAQDVCGEPGTACHDPEKVAVGLTWPFWSPDFAIQDMGTSGVTISFLTKSPPLIGWVGRIHERYPAWLLKYDFISANCVKAGRLEWNGIGWKESVHSLSQEEIFAAPPEEPYRSTYFNSVFLLNGSEEAKDLKSVCESALAQFSQEDAAFINEGDA